MSGPVARWLDQAAAHYANQKQASADVLSTIDRYTTIRPKTDVYTYDDGRTELLLCLHGLLPITYRNASYNIPVAVWLPRDHPKTPPIAYVVPTSEMLVRTGPHVDPSGRCAVAYLDHWAKKAEGCSLAGMLEALQDVFSREPPVYARPKESERPVDRSAPAPTTGERPTLPPKPGSTASPLPGPTHTPTTQPSPAPVFGNPNRPPPPLPDAAGSLSTATPYGTVDARTLPQGASPISAISPSPAGFSPLPGFANPNKPPPPPPSAFGARPSQMPSQRGQPPYGQAQSPPPPFVGSVAAPGYTSPAPGSGYASPAPAYLPQTYYKPPPPLPTPAPAPPPIRPAPAPAPNFLDADDLPLSAIPPASGPSATPARPPNPELLALHASVHAKLAGELSSLQHALALDAERLRAHQTDLLAGEPAVRDEMARLGAVRDVCRAVAGRYQGAVDAAERSVEEMRRRGEPSVDELVCATTIVHNQMIDLVAEDNALEDTMYHLHRALSAGRLDLERFLRTTRMLAEEQFAKRALIEKIQQGLGLAPALPHVSSSGKG